MNLLLRAVATFCVVLVGVVMVMNVTFNDYRTNTHVTAQSLGLDGANKVDVNFDCYGMSVHKDGVRVAGHNAVTMAKTHKLRGM